MYEHRYKTSADYGNIERLAQRNAAAANELRASAALEFAVLDTAWRSLELHAKQHGYDIFAAWGRAGGLAQKMSPQLHWLSAHFEGDGMSADVARRDVEELKIKNASYGESWKRRGGVGAFMMLARKWDRIETLLGYTGGGATFEHLLSVNPGNVLDDIGDLRRYFLLVEDEAVRLMKEQPDPAQPVDTLSPWRELAKQDLPAVGQEVLLLCVSTGEVVVADHKLDENGQPPETYWSVHGDRQYAIHEKWTHWCAMETKPAPDDAAEPGRNYVDQDQDARAG